MESLLIHGILSSVEKRKKLSGIDSLRYMFLSKELSDSAQFSSVKWWLKLRPFSFTCFLPSFRDGHCCISHLQFLIVQQPIPGGLLTLQQVVPIYSSGSECWPFLLPSAWRGFFPVLAAVVWTWWTRAACHQWSAEQRAGAKEQSSEVLMRGLHWGEIPVSLAEKIHLVQISSEGGFL